MAEAAHSGIDELARFARGLQEDLATVTAGLTLEWSNGVTEGQIHRLKFVKRQGYGRAGFALLRQRLLHGPRNGDSLTRTPPMCCRPSHARYGRLIAVTRGCGWLSTDGRMHACSGMSSVPEAVPKRGDGATEGSYVCPLYGLASFGRYPN
jgi:hypothetical protein